MPGAAWSRAQHGGEALRRVGVVLDPNVGFITLAVDGVDATGLRLASNPPLRARVQGYRFEVVVEAIGDPLGEGFGRRVAPEDPDATGQDHGHGNNYGCRPDRPEPLEETRLLAILRTHCFAG